MEQTKTPFEHGFSNIMLYFEKDAFLKHLERFLGQVFVSILKWADHPILSVGIPLFCG